MTEFVKEINEFIKKSLGVIYAKHSFLPVPEVNSFSSISNGVSQEAFIGPNAIYDYSVNYLPNFRVYNHALESLKERLLEGHEVFGGTMLVRYQGGRLANEFNVPGYEKWIHYKIKSEEDAIAMVTHHDQFMNSVGWKFFDITSTVEGINEYLNQPVLKMQVGSMNENEKAHFIRHNGIGAMVNGIVAAHLVKDNEFDKIVSNYRAIYFPDHIQESLNFLLKGISRD